METPARPNPRPWFSTFGEGYCRVCHFVEPLDLAGRIEPHPRHRSTGFGVGEGGTCSGTGKRPPTVTPWFSRLAMFRTKAEMAECPVCQRKVQVLADGRLSGHTVAFNTLTSCAGGYRPAPTAPGRDHQNERG